MTGWSSDAGTAVSARLVRLAGAGRRGAVRRWPRVDRAQVRERVFIRLPVHGRVLEAEQGRLAGRRLRLDAPGGARRDRRAARRVKAQPTSSETPLLGFEDPAMDWQPDEDPFADLGPVDPRPPANGASASGSGEPDKPR